MVKHFAAISVLKSTKMRFNMKTSLLSLSFLLTLQFTNAQTAKEFCIMAVDQFNANDLTDAFASFDKAIEADANYEYTYVCRASSYERLGKTDEAITDLETALQINPSHIEYLMKIGEIKMGINEIDQAIAYFNQYIELDATSPFAYFNRAAAYKEKHLYELALADIDDAILIEDEIPYLHYVKGNILLESGNAHDAITAFESALDIDSNYPEAYYNIAIAYFDLELYKKSLPYLDRAIEIDPYFGEAYYSRGLANNAIFNFERACIDMDQAAHMGVQPATAWMESHCTQ